MVVYCKSVHFNGFEDAKKNLSFYEMSSYKEGKAVKLAEESGEPDVAEREPPKAPVNVSPVKLHIKRNSDEQNMSGVV